MGTGGIYAGLSGATLETDEFELGHGLKISKTFAHLMAPFIMAFAPAPPGKHHPGPWSAVSGGMGFDILAEIFVPQDLEEALSLSPTFAAWWITAFVRLRLGPSVVVPVIGTHAFSAAKELGQKVTFHPIEVERPSLNLDPAARTSLSETDLAWIKRYWVATAQLFEESRKFRLLFEAVDQCTFARHATLALLWLWGGLEAVFSPAKNELRYRISSSIACYLESSGLGRMSVQKRIAKLYDSRSAAAHGRTDKESGSLTETYRLARRATLKIVEQNHVPTQEELEAKLFGADPT